MKSKQTCQQSPILLTATMPMLDKIDKEPDTEAEYHIPLKCSQFHEDGIRKIIIFAPKFPSILSKKGWGSLSHLLIEEGMC